MLKKKNDTIFYKDSRFYSSFPSIVKLPNEELLLVFRRARDVRWLINGDDELCEKLKNMVDHIDSRSQLMSLHLNQALEPQGDFNLLSPDPEAADQDASLLIFDENKLLLNSFSWYPIPSRLAQSLSEDGVSLAGHNESSGCFYIVWGGFTRLSQDLGKTWSEHLYLPKLPGAKDIIPGKRICHGGASRGQAIELGGELLVPVYRTLPSHTTGASHLYASKDKGKTWFYRSTIAIDHRQEISFNETSLLPLGDTSLMAFLRTSDKEDNLFTAISHDRGITWEKWQRREEIIGHPVHPLRLADGRIFLSYGYRNEPYGIRGRLMDEKAENFIGEELIIRDDGACADVGYPWACQLDNGNILVCYYFTLDDGVRHIAGSEIELEH